MVGFQHQPKGHRYLNNAENIASLTIQLNQQHQQQINRQIFNVLQEIVPEFLADTSTPSDLIVRDLTGGLSNRLLTVSLSSSPSPGDEHGENKEDNTSNGRSDTDDTVGDTLLIRLHNSGASPTSSTCASPIEGNTSEKSTPALVLAPLINRTLENQISAELSMANIAPTFYGRFLNGRIEEFYKGMRPLSCEEMSDVKYTKAIAVQLARLHKHKPQLNMKNGNGDGDENDSICEGQVWERIEGWVSAAKQGWSKAPLNASSTDEELKLVSGMLVDIQSEWNWLKSHKLYPYAEEEENQIEGEGDIIRPAEVRRAIEFSREIIFTHSDCQSLNILTPVKEHTSKGISQVQDTTTDQDADVDIRLIDFEYAEMNARATDLGNTFAEFCDMNNLKPNYETQYPSASIQDAFLMSYIAENDPSLAKELNGSKGSMDNFCIDLFLGELRAEIGKHSLLSHLGWALWALIQSCDASVEIDFDYVQYASIRMDGYYYFKRKFWPHLN